MNRERVYEVIASSLRKSGYPDVTADWIKEIHGAMGRGEETMPHGVVGLFAQRAILQLPGAWLGES